MLIPEAAEPIRQDRELNRAAYFSVDETDGYSYVGINGAFVFTDGMFAADELDYALPPGETLSMRLDELRMSQAELAVRTSLTPKHVNQLLHGLVPLSPDVAQRLEYAVGIPARWWNRLEADYRSAQTRLSAQTLSADK